VQVGRAFAHHATVCQTSGYRVRPQSAGARLDDDLQTASPGSGTERVLRPHQREPVAQQ